jgi:nitroimidazol reductase NimA-like FMN-containing flavoprotein (pyridoxamine 5'-phosphate oxidase superfamily)
MPAPNDFSERVVMLGQLTAEEIESVLREEFLGHIGGYAQGRPYVVPVAYAYDGVYVYGYTADGMKLRMMREHPQLCFEVERVENPANWRSVIAWGTFEVLTDSEALDALERLSARLRAVAASEKEQQCDAARSYVARAGRFGLAYRIRLAEKTGRFERSEPP